MRSYSSVLAALLALAIYGTSAQEVPACVNDCTSQARSQFPNFSCANADDAGCLCASIDFVYSIRDCASPTCGATEDNVRTHLSTGFCPNVSPSAEASAPAETSAPPAPSSVAPAESEAPSATEAPPSSTEAPTEASTTSEAPAQEVSSTEAPAITSAPPSSSAAISVETSATPATTSTSPSSTVLPTDENDDEDRNSGNQDNANENDDQDNGDDSGLPQAAVIGIAVGVGAVAVAGLLVAFLCWRRRRTSHPRRTNIEISNPMPSGGRSYGSPDHESFEKYGDIEMTTRYEDMLPRTQPRTMV
ncbi:hypothetical protein S40288_08508 [Stachybotrys chartarum IBT 40288]|nr:hypothetical protein S40288_08508 [Stachybotrys chartarum IBT 40288]